MRTINDLIAKLRSTQTTKLIGLCFRADGCQIATAALTAGTQSSKILDQQSLSRPPTVATLTEMSSQAHAVVIGGPGAFRTDGRLHFGVRALVNDLVGDPNASHALVASPRLPVPVYVWCVGDGSNGTIVLMHTQA